MDQQDQHPGQVLLIDKPLGWTSFDVVNKLRYKLKTKKIGHAGTLDPLATGLLILCTGKMTKRIDEYQAQ
jgi:tRNA pseudouridine55 synthase